MRLFGVFEKKKKVDFFDLLLKHAVLVHESYKVLIQYLQDGARNGALADKVMDLEHEADDVRRVLIDALNQTLVTPIDREDLFRLSRTIDDVIDSAKSTVEEVQCFQVTPTGALVEMTQILEKGAFELLAALKSLRDHPNVAKEHAIKAKQAENHMHHVYLRALTDLFNDSSITPGYMFKLREIYRHLNRSSDRCDEAANVIMDIIVKTE